MNEDLKKYQQANNTQNKAIINHGIFILIALALFGIGNAIHLIQNVQDSFIPTYYIYFPLTTCLILIIPGVLYFKFPSSAFVLGIIFLSLLLLRNFYLKNYFLLFIFTYGICALTFSLITIQKNNSQKKEQINSNILDDDF